MSVAEGAAPRGETRLTLERLRADFPILGIRVHGQPLVYLDNAATTQKPQLVIDAVRSYYEGTNANIHRGVHYLSQVATEAYEESRLTVARFLNARSRREIVFVRGATEGVNLVAQAFGRARLKPGDEILITALEHHSNIVPWQILCEQTGARLRVIPMTESGDLELDALPDLLNDRTRLASFIHVSNALGTVNPIARMIEACKAKGVPVVIDAAQSVPHMPVDVQALDPDFLVFSGHKVYGPTGIGVLYGKLEWLEQMPPYQGGGDMISSVTFERTIYNEVPHKFEAGTPHISGAIGLGAALDYVSQIGLEWIQAYESELLRYAEQKLLENRHVRLIGTPAERAGAISFMLEGVHPHDLGTILDQQGIAIRTGHHCAQPVMDYYGIPATARASLAFYNTREEIDLLVTGLDEAFEVFK